LLGRIDVLLEAYSYIDFKRRCDVMYAWLLELFRHCTRHADRLLAAVESMEARTIARGKRFDPRPRVGIDYGVARRGPDGALLFDYPAHAREGDQAVIVSYDQASITARRYPGERIEVYRVPHRRTFVATEHVAVPIAYLAPPELAERLERHGIRFERLDATTDVDVESYRILTMEKTFSPDVAGAVPPPGGAEIPLSQEPPPKRFETVVAVRGERRTGTFETGTLVIPTAQRAGILAIYLLEPASDDGFTRWEVLDASLKVGDFHPVHRVLHTGGPMKTPRGD
jgi:hypothetical protein